MHLSNATNATIFDADGTGTITNDDAQPAFSINDVTLAELALEMLFPADSQTIEIAKNMVQEQLAPL